MALGLAYKLNHLLYDKHKHLGIYPEHRNININN